MPYKNREQQLEYFRVYNKTHKHKCIKCGKEISRSSTYCRHCCNLRERNGLWKGDAVSKDVARHRSYCITTKSECAKCKSKKHLDIHHKDGNPYNNDKTNLIVLCRTCHMIEDNRMCNRDKFGKFTKEFCPECGAKLINVSGCKECSCGFSYCG